ncbi:hypothetical protein KC19_10G041100 [Ceratodon purpureus]|uniref:Exostosin GT47 domain-containing protein n=1 Tax=Ceratodon purpureus TaxID=3225 RepID=A0A8T0GJ89_CERPU|nr:hypothetical protein KC19_10G041100 [Ceratodon purpureus]
MFPALMKKRFLKGKLGKLRNYDQIELSADLRNRIFLVTACLAFIFLVRYCFSPNSSGGTFPQSSNGRCQGRYVYMHSLPREFNEELLANCNLLHEWTNMCAALSNAGLGPAIPVNQAEIFTPTGWFRTHQFALETIFHNRMKQYDCLTRDSKKASAIYVPYYAGLEAQRTLWENDLAARDISPKKLEEWLLSQPEWNAHRGHDHFMVGGRITWDFRRQGPGWGNNLLALPGIQNMTTLVIEASPWDTIDVAIPYPSYFHPSSDMEIRAWQEKVRGFERKFLFSFAGGRRDDRPRLIRGQLIQQCRQSPFCELLTCDGGACLSPQPVMKLFEDSHFCLQPQGDSATRKSIFDSLLAGCIPVFFHQDSYSGYTWHLPKNESEYSVFILENYVRTGTLSVESVLRNIPAERIQQMRETIIELIPNLVYADPRSPTLETSTDAFGIAMKGVFERISEKKRGLQKQ